MAELDPPTLTKTKRGDVVVKIKRATVAAILIALAGLAVKWKNDKDTFDITADNWHVVGTEDEKKLHEEIRAVHADLADRIDRQGASLDRLSNRIDNMLNVMAGRRITLDTGEKP